MSEEERRLRQGRDGASLNTNWLDKKTVSWLVRKYEALFYDSVAVQSCDSPESIPLFNRVEDNLKAVESELRRRGYERRYPGSYNFEWVRS